MKHTAKNVCKDECVCNTPHWEISARFLVMDYVSSHTSFSIRVQENGKKNYITMTDKDIEKIVETFKKRVKESKPITWDKKYTHGYGCSLTILKDTSELRNDFAKMLVSWITETPENKIFTAALKLVLDM